MAIEASIEQLAARESIKDLRAEYSHRVDNREWEAWADLFTEDAEYQLAGANPINGRAEILSFARSKIAGLYSYSLHSALMPRLDVNAREGTGTGEWYILVYYEKSESRTGWVFGTYEDEYRRVDGEWKFASMIDRVRRDTGPSPHIE